MPALTDEAVDIGEEIIDVLANHALNEVDGLLVLSSVMEILRAAFAKRIADEARGKVH